MDNTCIDPSWAATHDENPFSENLKNYCADLKKIKPDSETTVLVW